MKQFRFFITLILLTLGMQMSADNLSVENISINAGEEKEIAIVLSNPENKYVAFQFDMVLPAGVSIPKNERGKYKVKLNTERCDDHTWTVDEVASGTYRFIVYSMSNTEIIGTDGPLAYITLLANNDITGNELTCLIKQQKFIDNQSTQHRFDDFTVGITIISDEVVITADDKEREYGDANPPLTYTASNTLNGQPKLSTSATKASPVGTYPITVEKGTVDYPNLRLVDGTLTVKKAKLTVTAKSYTIMQTDPLPEFEATYSGWKNDENESALPKKPTFTCNVPADKTPGTYTITVGGAESANYEITYVAGTLTIFLPDEVVITADDKEREYGDANPQLTYTASGTFNGQPKLSTFATKASTVGTYPITVEKGTVDYPNLRLVDGTLTVKKAKLTVTAKSYTIMHTDPLPEFEATYSGWKNGENESALPKKPTFTCNVPAGKTPGTYTITVGGAESANYDITYVAGTLTIIPELDEVVISNPTAGHLRDRITEAGYESSNIESIIINGNLNGTDIKLIREMILNGKLTVLDIKDCNIVSGGEPYYESYVTKDNVIGEYAFYYCRNLVSIEFPNSVNSIGRSSFYGCDKLKDISIPGSVISIGINAFNSCSSVRTINFCEGLSTIGESAFYDCDKLESVSIPASVTSIGSQAFANTDALVSIIVSSDNSFYDSRQDCNAIIESATNKLIAGASTTVIPETVVTIGEYAFYYCRNLVSIEFPNSVNSIGRSSFYGCYKLKDISIPGSVISIGINAFNSCSSVRTINLCEGLSTIGESAFYDCDKLESVSIPASVTSIGSQAFANTDALVSIIVSSDNSFYDSRQDCNAIIESATNKLIAGASTTVIPETVVTIGEYAFYYCRNLVSIEFPNSVNSIERSSFYECEKLKDIISNIQDITKVDVHDSAFNGIPSDCTWHVLGTIDKYTNCSWWNKTWNIETGIMPIVCSLYDNNAWYTLQGVKLDVKPTKPGIYVHGGRKIVIK